MAKVLLILSDRIGTGDDRLGAVLMRNFLYSLARDPSPPAIVNLANGGVRLACKGSEHVENLRMLVEKGVAVRACGTCLDYLNLKDSLAVGEVGTMPDLVAVICGGDEVVTIA